MILGLVTSLQGTDSFCEQKCVKHHAVLTHNVHVPAMIAVAFFQKCVGSVLSALSNAVHTSCSEPILCPEILLPGRVSSS
jgi:hypothetical protein